MASWCGAWRGRLTANLAGMPNGRGAIASATDDHSEPSVRTEAKPEISDGARHRTGVACSRTRMRGPILPYDEAAATLRAPLAADVSDRRDLVRYATLAANSHNTQPWKFRIGKDTIDILPDLRRRTPVVDPDDHHLFCTLGCATENLLLAAQARGLAGDVTFVPAGGGHVNVALTPTAPRETAAFKAIPARGVSRTVYDGKPIPLETIRTLETVARSDMVDVVMLTDRTQIDRVMALVIEGNRVQFTDDAFMAELKNWFRFDSRQAIAAGDGLFAGCSGIESEPKRHRT